MDISVILRDLFVMFLAAKLAGELFERLRQPPVIGELLAGCLIGPHALGLVGRPITLAAGGVGLEQAEITLNTVYQVLAQLGVVVLLFFVGLETPLSDLLQVGVRATVVAVAGVCLPFALGAAWMLGRGAPPVQALFVGAALVATSVGITARVLADLHYLHSREARVILAAAVIDDVLGLLVLAVVSAIGRDGYVDAAAMASVAVQAVAFIGLVALLGTRVVRRVAWRVEALRIRNAPLVVAMATCLGLAALASQVGLAAIIGAFLAGIAFAETRDRFALEQRGLPIYELLVPFFFVLAGSQVDPAAFLDADVIGLALIITALAALGKIVACGLGAWGLGARSMAMVGVGMVPRGEVGLIIANAGASLVIIPPAIFSVVVMMSIITTVAVPPILALLRSGAPTPGPFAEVAPSERVLPDM